MMDIRVSVGVYVFIKQDGKDIVVRGEYGTFGYNMPLLFFYYPNANAYKAIIERNNYFSDYYEIPLEKHDFLNGAFYFGGWDDVSTEATSIPSVSSDAERTIEVTNKIYTSEVNNPFYFPVLGINTVGTGNILGICAAAKHCPRVSSDSSHYMRSHRRECGRWRYQQQERTPQSNLSHVMSLSIPIASHR